MSVNDGSQLQTYQNVLCLNIFFTTMVVEILYQGNYPQGKEHECYLENLCVH